MDNSNVMKSYILFIQYGHGRTTMAGVIDSDTAKNAFMKALRDFYVPQEYDKINSFYVQSRHCSPSESYGYDYFGQRVSNNGFRTSGK